MELVHIESPPELNFPLRYGPVPAGTQSCVLPDGTVVDAPEVPGGDWYELVVAPRPDDYVRAVDRWDDSARVVHRDWVENLPTPDEALAIKHEELLEHANANARGGTDHNGDPLATDQPFGARNEAVGNGAGARRMRLKHGRVKRYQNQGQMKSAGKAIGQHYESSDAALEAHLDALDVLHAAGDSRGILDHDVSADIPGAPWPANPP